MQRRRPPVTRGFAMLLVVAALGAAAAACSRSGGAGRGSASSSPAYVASCGSARSAADVPVQVKIARGHASCRTAKAVVAAYATAIRSGQAPGNGGGGPVKVNGWTCEGFATPVVLHTGKASKCVKDGDEILEILPPVRSRSPSPSPSSSSSRSS